MWFDESPNLSLQCIPRPHFTRSLSLPSSLLFLPPSSLPFSLLHWLSLPPSILSHSLSLCLSLPYKVCGRDEYRPPRLILSLSLSLSSLRGVWSRRVPPSPSHCLARSPPRPHSGTLGFQTVTLCRQRRRTHGLSHHQRPTLHSPVLLLLLRARPHFLLPAPAPVLAATRHARAR